ncbi:hypothetical protein D3875_02885 [Deinococcus cavernae]|uniref:Uncharacterized protein n=1 Tax=Deinococcus cavernae TaxID=2320857 RepID=A0A418VFT9_9DEIO|nr:hypothetical protein [Deinococcus cavernae]RJF74958.1 hypothetical protein D3875_02885 [Deinococcus cavernae]
MPLPVLTHRPPHLATRTDLKNAGLVPTGDPVALYRFRCPGGGYQTCSLYSRKETRNAREARNALKRRQANLGGQVGLFEGDT